MNKLYIKLITLKFIFLVISNSVLAGEIGQKKLHQADTTKTNVFTDVLQRSGDFGAGNGGDECEREIQHIRNEIKNWILDGGHEYLSLPSSISKEKYKNTMLDAITFSKFSCTTDKLKIFNAEKTCKNFVDKNGEKRILCNSKSFFEINESSRYTLIHHELAGVSGFEVNNTEEESNYFISNQLTGFMKVVRQIKLSIVPIYQKDIKTTSNFDPIAKLNEGNQLYLESLDVIKDNIKEITNGRDKSVEIQNYLLNIQVPNQNLKQLYQKCGQQVSEAIDRDEERYNKAYVTDLEIKQTQELNKLKENVLTYTEYDKQLTLDPELRNEILNRYKTLIYKNINKLKLREHSYFSSETYVYYVSHNTPCYFHELFDFEDSKKFKRLSYKSGIHKSYLAFIYPINLFTGEYYQTLNFIAKNSPIKVARTAYAFGSANSRYENSVVNINIVYDYSFLSGYENVEHPKVRNPIEVIKQ